MTQIEGVTLASRSDWTVLRPLLFESIGQTLEMVLVTMIVGGILGLVLGVVLYGTRPGNLFENAVVYRILDVIVNIIRPIPFIILVPTTWVELTLPKMSASRAVFIEITPSRRIISGLFEISPGRISTLSRKKSTFLKKRSIVSSENVSEHVLLKRHLPFSIRSSTAS